MIYSIGFAGIAFIYAVIGSALGWLLLAIYIKITDGRSLKMSKEKQPEVKPFEQKWYGVKCYDSRKCDTHWLCAGNGTFYCYPVRLFAEIHAEQYNRWGDKFEKYVCEEVK